MYMFPIKPCIGGRMHHIDQWSYISHMIPDACLYDACTSDQYG